MNEPRRKRPKISRGEDDYMPGSIVEIELHNFMTFNNLTCKPGPRLNLVVGPNGSGKSSLVCAIALGLGGEPQLLGRASSVGAFVKRGEETGYIKISLRGNTKEERLTIMRKIDTRNKSEWLFNGKSAPKKDVIEVIQQFNIQINNLTQFLPQDRVCEFAKLTPVQLLEETEKAVGDPQLPVQHRALIDKSGELKKLERTVQRNGEYLGQLKSLNAEQERDVERVRQREELLAKVELMKKKLPWLKYDMKKAEYMEAKDQENDAKKKLDEAAKSLNEAKEPIEKKKKGKASQDTKCKQVRNLLDNNAKKRMQLVESEHCLGVQVRGKYNEIEELKRQEESRQQRISRAKEELIAAEVELTNLPSYEPPKDELERLSAQILELEETAREKRHQKAEKERLLAQNKGTLRQCADRLRDMENTNNKLLQALRNSGAEKIFEAYHWVQEHRHEFNKEVYGPVLLEVKVSNRAHADYLEGHIPYYIWKSFITQDPGDRDFLVKNLGSLDVPVINHMGESRDAEPFHVSEEMHTLGIYSRLDQVFDAPNAVKEVLIGQFGLEYSYIGSKETDKRADEIQRLGIFDFWTPENHYRWSKSRYGGHVSAIVEPVDHSHLLLCNQDVGELERLRSRKKELDETVTHLGESLKSLQMELRQAEDEAAKLQRQREEIISFVQLEKRKRREMENRIKQRKIKLTSMEQEDDLDTVIAKLVDHAAQLNTQRFQCAIDMKDLIIEAVAYRRSFAEKNMACIELEAKIREMENNVKQQEQFALQASLHVEYCKKEAEDCRQQLLVAKRHAESVALITPELEQAFLEMPATIEDLEAAIQDTVSQANSVYLLNHNILEEYESRQKKIEELSKKQELDEKQLSRQMDEINALKGSWLPTLKNLVAQINETFSNNFREMAVAGEVSLDEHDMDYDKYGILIKVKFRQAGQLQVLSAHHQSGGERSVSTILYLVSLQDLTNCPFRVVDEINQGMDPINERKMFQQLVRAASQSNTPQCFLLTPKLLPNLEYSEACSILTVMNGPWIEQPSKVWSSGDCWGSVVGLLGASHC
ncbi:Structural maintenance of chromosomes protein [Actinidia chinensis var. chinensis]|uniref:Structural maintenance of chromosomes protein 5 n=1 Tax=Actinidia chinensis var. chinensis TaxID=1590841 RepID=A0A2R6RD65_ACTCC|nr:Structural maintenance of chromosomes protein [Actinidia chinensis var. chinensis]